MTHSEAPKYAIVEGWEQLPSGYAHRDVAGVAVDLENRVFLICRGDHPIIMYDERALPGEARDEPLRHDAGAARGFEHAHPRVDRKARDQIVRVAVEKERPEIAVVVLRNRPDERGIAVSHGGPGQSRCAAPCHEICDASMRPHTSVSVVTRLEVWAALSP